LIILVAKQTMVKAILTLLATVDAATLAVTWGDCGAKHATVDDLSPTSIKTGGSATTLIGTGISDEDVTSATFTAVVKASGVKVASCSGDATSDIVCKLPAGVGTITVKAVTFPLKAGRVNIPVDVKVSSLIPASLATTSTHIEAVDQNGESVICLDVNTKKAAELEVAATGSCSSADQAALADASAVGDKQDACGKGALSLTGIKHDKYVNCVEDSLGVSAGCAECYYTVAQYGFKNCKAACLLGWCKSGCLSCTQPAQDGLSGCTGFTPSVASPCLEMEPNATSGKCEDNCKAVLTGMLNGLLSDSEDFDTCSLDGLTDVLMLAASVEDLKEKKVLDFFTDLSVALANIEPTVGDCKVVGAEVKKLTVALKAASPAHLAANVKTHHTEIFEAVAAWSEARDAEDYKTTGEQLGKIIRKVLEEDGAAMV